MNRRLDAVLDARPHDGERERPARLVEAMRHAALGGGKRLRPLLMIETARAFGRSDHGVLTAAAALECVHCYSLVHDDLPAMDDDDMRRGRPTVHKTFDEATAILAGDALLTIAFDLIADEEVHADAGKRLALSRDLARAAGLGGMAGGQMLDLESENRARSEDEIRTLQSMKTGALIRYATRAGASLADARPDDVARMTRFGELIGLGFQLADDLLDVEGDSVTLGKTAGKDIAAGKATLVALKGVDWTRNALKELVSEADSLLSPLGEKGARLSAVAHFVAERRA
ncbi:polyprenyl synthetase family protein [Rhizobiales bacterium]|uniref:polyprenyl synthetase family protein n=1 Tax=Hongsoonwoonella zoysiae TaxID=2821844 RepID=UPI001560912A|nr:farnesyl diphosphate synthase [Hongsoonwoonella zoysiae]NRG16981.1 polyprenyl synthetase family protein [Hongsoonwoonella zoysiae]